MHKARGKPRIWGYARVSKGKDGRVVRAASQATNDASDEPSNERQAAGIEKKAAEIAAEHGCVLAQIFTDTVSGADVGFDERPGYQKLIREIEPGDHLVVWQLSRIDRNPFRLYRACEFLVGRDVHIHSYGDTQGEIDLSTAMGRAQLAIWGIVNDLFIENLRKSIKEALQWRKENGLAYNISPPLGKRREYTKHGEEVFAAYMLNGTVVRKTPSSDDKDVVKHDIWDEKECRLIREIKERHDKGESFDVIGQDFADRGETTHDGKAWVRFYRKRRPGYNKRRIDSRRIRRCYMAYEALLAEGKDLGL